MNIASLESYIVPKSCGGWYILAWKTIACDITVFENMSKQRKQQENKKKSISHGLELTKMLDETNTVIRFVKDITYKTICEKTIKIDFQFKFFNI